MPIHIEAKKGDVAQKVLLVGDPDRASTIAEQFLKEVNCYTKYRHMFGYTGLYKNKEISIQTTGMGTPSLTIIVEELNMLEVKEIVRLGTCGTIKEDVVKLGDTVILNASHSSHDIYAREFPGASYSAVPNFELTANLYRKSMAKDRKSKIHIGSGLCSETFYESTFSLYQKFAEYGTLCVEMESYALFALSAKYGIKSGTILSVSDLIFEKKRANKEIIKESVLQNAESVLDFFVEH